METNQPVAVITGASSGIGKAFAERFAAMGYNLMITGRREILVEKVASEITEKFGVWVKTCCGDLSDPRCREDLVDRIRRAGQVEVLVNNAGFGIEKPFHSMDLGELHSMISTHDLAPVELIHALLPGMIRRRNGVIINVSSLAALLPGLSEISYLATKSFLHQLSLGLHIELAPYGIHVQSLCPGLVKSDFHRSLENASLRCKFETIGMMRPEKVVEWSLYGVAKKTMVCIPGWNNRLFYVIARMMPMGAFRVLSRFKGARPEAVDPKVIRMTLTVNAA
jgi:short-subunit dehydrogenase